jgi:RHS repeat-associated protein
MADLCYYHYDPLDRLASRHPLAEAIAQRFYKGTQLATERQGGEQRSYLRTGAHLLAQISEVGNLRNRALVATDQQSSVLSAITQDEHHPIAYTPYGHRQGAVAPPGMPGFNGEQPDSVTGHYLLGNGYRAFNPVLMRFNSPDSLSPFGAGGLNAYAYCVGDPVNVRDPTGHVGNRGFRPNFTRNSGRPAVRPAQTPLSQARPIDAALARPTVTGAASKSHTSLAGSSADALLSYQVVDVPEDLSNLMNSRFQQEKARVLENFSKSGVDRYTMDWINKLNKGRSSYKETLYSTPYREVSVRGADMSNPSPEVYKRMFDSHASRYITGPMDEIKVLGGESPLVPSNDFYIEDLYGLETPYRALTTSERIQDFLREVRGLQGMRYMFGR